MGRSRRTPRGGARLAGLTVVALAAAALAVWGRPEMPSAGAVPSAPLLLSAAYHDGPDGTAGVRLEWTPGAGSASYRVYRSPLGGGGLEPVGEERSGTVCVVPGPADPRDEYRVVALDAWGRPSEPSNALRPLDESAQRSARPVDTHASCGYGG